MVNQTQSVRTLVAKIYADLRLSDNSYDLYFVDWIGEALAHIGSHPQFELKEAVIDVTDHKAALPGTLVHLNAVAFAPDTKSEDILSSTGVVSANKRLLPESGAHFHAAIHKNSFTADDLQEKTFVRTPGYIHTYYKTGAIIISYLAYPLDADGFPLVPDHPSFFDACKWYCVTRMVEGGWKHPAGLDFFQCEDRWLKYCSQARNKANMPDQPQMERFAEMWVRMIPDHDAPKRLFSRGDTNYTQTPFFTEHIDLGD